MINVSLTLALPRTVQHWHVYAMQCERADNDRAAVWVMSVERHRWVPTIPNICQTRVGLMSIGMPFRDFNLIGGKLSSPIVYHCFCGHI